MTYFRDAETLGKLAGDREAPTPVTLAEWVNAGRCPPEALHEAGRLVIDLKLAAPRAKLGTDVRWAGAEDYRPALGRMEVNADSILFWWWEYPRTEGWVAATDTDRSAMADWWNSMPLAERPIEADFDDLPRPNRVIKNASSLDRLANQWNAAPEGERPEHFPLDPVVQAWIKNRDSGSPVLNADAQPDSELSLEDYIPDWQRYQQDVRQAVEKDAKEKNGQDVHTALERAAPTLAKYGELRTEDIVDLLVGLLRAADCELHQGACPIEKLATEYIKTLIAQLGRLGDLEHGRVHRALDYAEGREKYGTDLPTMYLNQRDDGAS
jgi:hypothetical protein